MSTAMNLDRPLDEIISDKRKQQRRSGGVSRRGGRTNGTGPIRTARAPRAQPSVAPAPATKTLQLPPQMGNGSKIIVSNLPPDVTENQIRELFYTTVGQVTRVALSYDSRGTSKGTAQVEFRRNDDATKAFQQYNKRLIDQNRPMKVEIVVDPARIPPPPLSTRVAPVNKQNAPASAGVNGRTTGNGNRGGSFRGRGKAGNRGPQKTAAELDAEMEEYQKANE